MNTDGHGFNWDVGPKVGSSLASAVSERPQADCLRDEPRQPDRLYSGRDLCSSVSIRG